MGGSEAFTPNSGGVQSPPGRSGVLNSQTYGNGATTYSYTYDTTGNIITANGHTYTYGNAEWRDLLTAYDGQTITYDNIGNPTSYYNGTRWTFNWENGRRLANASDGTNNVSYTYDLNGLRTSKVVNGVTHTYYYAGGNLLRETYGDYVLDFFYDANGTPVAMKQNNTVYYYITNLQGDVIRLVDIYGQIAAMYQYDPYGNAVYALGSHAEINPLRYRGYVYDTDTGLYYLQSRYYDPKIGRFINADEVTSTGQGILGTNMFAYCGNNPIIREDSSGNSFETIFDIISLGSSIAGVVVNPADPWAWLALAGDIADVAIPFVGGLGEAAKALKAVSEAAGYVEDAVDVIEFTTNTLQVVSDAAKTLNSGNNSVYVAYTSDGLLEYVGITNDFNRRKKEWDGIREIEKLVSDVDRAGARYVEQTVITLFGMKKNGGILSNSINSIGSRGSKYAGYIEFISDLLD